MKMFISFLRNLSLPEALGDGRRITLVTPLRIAAASASKSASEETSSHRYGIPVSSSPTLNQFDVCKRSVFLRADSFGVFIGLAIKSVKSIYMRNLAVKRMADVTDSSYIYFNLFIYASFLIMFSQTRSGVDSLWL